MKSLEQRYLKHKNRRVDEMWERYNKAYGTKKKRRFKNKTAVQKDLNTSQSI